MMGDETKRLHDARAVAERDHGTFLDPLTPENRERALAFAEKTATDEWQSMVRACVHCEKDECDHSYRDGDYSKRCGSQWCKCSS